VSVECGVWMGAYVGGGTVIVQTNWEREGTVGYIACEVGQGVRFELKVPNPLLHLDLILHGCFPLY
jgi:hypothetical protein